MKFKVSKVCTTTCNILRLFTLFCCLTVRSIMLNIKFNSVWKDIFLLTLLTVRFQLIIFLFKKIVRIWRNLIFPFRYRKIAVHASVLFFPVFPPFPFFLSFPSFLLILCDDKVNLNFNILAFLYFFVFLIQNTQRRNRWFCDARLAGSIPARHSRTLRISISTRSNK